MPRVKLEELREKRVDYKKSDGLRAHVVAAREIQQERFKKLKGKITNSELSSKECDELIDMEPGAESFLKQIFEQSLVSARGYYRTIKVSRTIADLEGAKTVSANHLAEAFSYRLREA